MTPPRLHKVKTEKTYSEKIMSFLNARIHIITTRFDVILVLFLMIFFLLLCFALNEPTYIYVNP